MLQSGFQIGWDLIGGAWRDDGGNEEGRGGLGIRAQLRQLKREERGGEDKEVSYNFFIKRAF